MTQRTGVGHYPVEIVLTASTIPVMSVRARKFPQDPLAERCCSKRLYALAYCDGKLMAGPKLPSVRIVKPEPRRCAATACLRATGDVRYTLLLYRGAQWWLQQGYWPRPQVGRWLPSPPVLKPRGKGFFRASAYTGPRVNAVGCPTAISLCWPSCPISHDKKAAASSG